MTRASLFRSAASRIDIHGLRLGCLLSALILYACLGSPTPDNPGLIEIIIGALLVLAVGVQGTLSAVQFKPEEEPWKVAGQVLLVFGLIIPLIISVMQGQSASLILRDMIPFLFLGLPIFLGSFFKNHPQYCRYLLAGVLCVGVAFSVRSIADSYNLVLSFFFPAQSGELYYFANMPTVLFAALFFMGAGGEKLGASLTIQNIAWAVALFALSIIVLIPVVLTLQRASLGYASVYGVLLTGFGLFYSPKRTALFLALGFAVLVPFWGFAQEALALLAQKTSLVGFNIRFEELSAVWAEISSAPHTLIFGNGWGGTFESPAVADIRVNFTHSLLSSALLKMGLVGVILVILYIFALGRVLLSALPAKPVLALALAGPLFIDVFLYASFKSLDFGLILLLIAILPILSPKVASTP